MQQCLAAGCKVHEHFGLILISVPAPHGVPINDTIYKLSRAVMAKAELMGERGHGGTSVPSQALNGQEKLMLLGFNTLGAGGFLAKMHKLRDTVPELSKRTKVSC
jgi:hypothetical protein